MEILLHSMYLLQGFGGQSKLETGWLKIELGSRKSKLSFTHKWLYNILGEYE